MARLLPVAPGVLVATSRREHTTTTAVIATIGGTRRVLLIDPCWDPDELAEIGADLAAAELRVVAGLSTHAHHDHLLWHPSFGVARRFASAETARRAVEDRAGLLRELGPGWPQELVAPFGQVEALGAPALPWEGPEVELVVHDAHLPGHTAVWVAHLELLVAGDMLSDIELPLPDTDRPETDAGSSRPPTGGPLATYLEGLDRLAPYVAAAALVIPGHGTPTADGRARLDADRRYLEATLAGRRCDDGRLAHPGMAEAHRRTAALVDSAS